MTHVFIFRKEIRWLWSLTEFVTLCYSSTPVLTESLYCGFGRVGIWGIWGKRGGTLGLSTSRRKPSDRFTAATVQMSYLQCIKCTCHGILSRLHACAAGSQTEEDCIFPFLKFYSTITFSVTQSTVHYPLFAIYNKF